MSVWQASEQTKVLIKDEYEYSKQNEEVERFFNSNIYQVISQSCNVISIKWGLENWINCCCELNIDHMEGLKQSMNIVDKSTLTPSLLSELAKLDFLLDPPYDIFCIFVLIMYARTVYELIMYEKGVITITLDSEGWKALVKQSDLGQYIDRCHDYIDNVTEVNDFTRTFFSY